MSIGDIIGVSVIFFLAIFGLYWLVEVVFAIFKEESKWGKR